MQPKERHVFLCYSTKDRRFVDRLYSDLSACGISIWLDKVELKAGDSLPGRIGSAITEAEFVIVVLSPNSMESKWVRQELEIAVDRQINEQDRLIVPILRKNCTLPPFLRGRLYVDFQNMRRYKESFEKLLRALDEKPGDHPAAPPESLKKSSFIEDLSESIGEDSEWMKVFQELPLTEMLVKAIRLNSFSGSTRKTIMLGLIMASHAGGGITFNNLCALLGFLSDAEKRNLVDPSYLGLLTQIVENRNIEVDYRWFALGFVFRRLKVVSNRRLRLGLMPNIFGPNSFDPLADRLIEEFFASDSEKEDGLMSLWAAGSSFYREEILAYIERAGCWSDSTRIRKDLHLEPDATLLLKALGGRWRGLRSNNSDQLTREGIMKELEVALHVEPLNLGNLVFAIENASIKSVQDAKGLLGSLIDFVVDNAIPFVADRYNDGLAFQLVSSIVASPFIEPALSTMALITCAKEFGLDSLAYSDNFPDCLLVPRDSCFSPFRFSVIAGLANWANEQDDDGLAYIILVNILSMFPYAPLYAAVDMHLDELPALTPKLSALRRLIYGEVTAHVLLSEPTASEE